MSVEVVLPIYGAVLATALALAQLGSWWSRRVKLEIVTGVEHRSISEDEREIVRGAPIQVARGNELLWEEVLIVVEIRNTGGAPVQVVAIVVESVENGMCPPFRSFLRRCLQCWSPTLGSSARSRRSSWILLPGLCSSGWLMLLDVVLRQPRMLVSVP